MSRRKQANPAKLGDEDCVELTDLASRVGEHSFIPLRVPTLIAGELDEIQCRACTRYVRSQSSSPTPIKRAQIITHKSFSDGDDMQVLHRPPHPFLPKQESPRSNGISRNFFHYEYIGTIGSGEPRVLIGKYSASKKKLQK
ncbi:hypothetical protein WA026_004619 [Henosepilachna vigintioctopunctata]|uniref:Uncharacterized protein n=1 Tax=Henosepilachna vigintioctopunctata TaxID=420089 RepID=A0AAW1V3W4_9CUCU